VGYRCHLVRQPSTRSWRCEPFRSRRIPGSLRLPRPDDELKGRRLRPERGEALFGLDPTAIRCRADDRSPDGEHRRVCRASKRWGTPIGVGSLMVRPDGDRSLAGLLRRERGGCRSRSPWSQRGLCRKSSGSRGGRPERFRLVDEAGNLTYATRTTSITAGTRREDDLVALAMHEPSPRQGRAGTLGRQRGVSTTPSEDHRRQGPAHERPPRRRDACSRSPQTADANTTSRTRRGDARPCREPPHRGQRLK